MSQFVSKITPEKKKLRELKFNIYISATQSQEKSDSEKGDVALVNELQKRLNEPGQRDPPEETTYISIVVDKNNKNSTLSKKVDGFYVRAFVVGLIDSINHILSIVEQQYHKYCLVNIKSENIYILTLINSWISIWENNNFENRLFATELAELNKLLKIINFKTVLIHKSCDEYAWSLDKKINELTLKI